MKPQYIISNPNILAGKPTFTGTRISVSMVVDHLANGWTIDQMLQEFPTLKLEYIQEALRLSAYLINNDEVIYA
jgi:uncharacterized protein (DUF433 family)